MVGAAAVPCSVIRDFSVMVFLRSLNLAPATPPAQVKEPFKELLGQAIALAAPRLRPMQTNAHGAPEGYLSITALCTHPASDGELEALIEAETGAKHPKKRARLVKADPHAPSVGAGLIAAALAVCKDDVLRETFSWPPEPASLPCEFVFSSCNASLFVAGKYNKLRRGLSHSPWTIGGRTVGAGSVEESIAPRVAPLFAAGSTRFYSAGREDIDVRMLGDGRPFSVELVDPRRTPSREELEALQASIAESECGRDGEGAGNVVVSGLRLVPREYVTHVREGEKDKRKKYRAVVWVERRVDAAVLAALNAIENLVVHQKTPVRVLHTRSPLVRPRTVFRASAERINDHFVMLDVTTEAGTYIKELVHGDFRRSSPSIGEILGCEVDIIQLDVMGLEMDF